MPQGGDWFDSFYQTNKPPSGGWAPASLIPGDIPEETPSSVAKLRKGFDDLWEQTRPTAGDYAMAIPKGFAQGVMGAAGSSIAGLGTFTGIDSLMHAGRAVAEAGPEVNPQLQDSLFSTIPQALGSSAATLAGGIAGELVGGPAGAAVGAGLTSVGMEGGGGSIEALQRGADPATARRAGLLTAPAGLLDILPEASQAVRLAKGWRLARGAAQELGGLERLLSLPEKFGAPGRTLATGGAEFFQETSQGAWEQYAQKIAGTIKSDEEARSLDEIAAQEGVPGGFAGAIQEGILSYFTRHRAKTLKGAPKGAPTESGPGGQQAATPGGNLGQGVTQPTDSLGSDQYSSIENPDDDLAEAIDRFHQDLHGLQGRVTRPTVHEAPADLQARAGRLGARVVLYDGADALVPTGYYDPPSKTIFINRQASTEEQRRAVFEHEKAHFIRSRFPGTYEAYVAAINAVDPTWLESAAAKREGLQRGLTGDDSPVKIPRGQGFTETFPGITEDSNRRGKQGPLLTPDFAQEEAVATTMESLPSAMSLVRANRDLAVKVALYKPSLMRTIADAMIDLAHTLGVARTPSVRSAVRDLEAILQREGTDLEKRLGVQKATQLVLKISELDAALEGTVEIPEPTQDVTRRVDLPEPRADGEPHPDYPDGFPDPESGEPPARTGRPAQPARAAAAAAAPSPVETESLSPRDQRLERELATITHELQGEADGRRRARLERRQAETRREMSKAVGDRVRLSNGQEGVVARVEGKEIVVRTERALQPVEDQDATLGLKPAKRQVVTREVRSTWNTAELLKRAPRPSATSAPHSRHSQEAPKSAASGGNAAETQRKRGGIQADNPRPSTPIHDHPGASKGHPQESTGNPQPSATPTLPWHLAGARPRYNRGTGDVFRLTFESDVDKAVYVVGRDATLEGRSNSARHDEFRGWLAKQGLDRAAIRVRYRQILRQLSWKAKHEAEGAESIHVSDAWEEPATGSFALPGAGRRRPGPENNGVGLPDELVHRLNRILRVRAKVGTLRLGDKPRIVQETTNANADRLLTELDRVLEKFPRAADSLNDWATMMAYAFGTSDVPIPPYAFIRDVNGNGAIERLRTLTDGQRADAQHGFETAKKMLARYAAGEMSVADTARLFLWGYLSRGVSPYTQEALFIDAFEGIDPWIDRAIDHPFTAQDVEDYVKWADTIAPAGSGVPGSGAKHNLNSFGRHFLVRMSQPHESGKTILHHLHDLMSDTTKTGKEIRREFARVGEGAGIDNKVVSFALLVSGRNDLMVLDRVQARQTFDDGRFVNLKGEWLNLYDGFPDPTKGDEYDENGKKKKRDNLPGSKLSEILSGVRGLLIYEAMERRLHERVGEIYKELGREGEGSPGRYHWETWVAFSGQEASHQTVDAILNKAANVEQAIADVAAKQGEYGTYQYGASYARNRNGEAYFGYTLPSGETLYFSLPAFRRFIDGIQTASNKIRPAKFKVSENERSAWYFHPDVNQQRLEALARRESDIKAPDGQPHAGDGHDREGLRSDRDRTSGRFALPLNERDADRDSIREALERYETSASGTFDDVVDALRDVAELPESVQAKLEALDAVREEDRAEWGMRLGSDDEEAALEDAVRAWVDGPARGAFALPLNKRRVHSDGLYSRIEDLLSDLPKSMTAESAISKLNKQASQEELKHFGIPGLLAKARRSGEPVTREALLEHMAEQGTRVEIDTDKDRYLEFTIGKTDPDAKMLARSLVVRLTGRSAFRTFSSSHWSQPDVLAHARYNTGIFATTPDRKSHRVLLVDEVQSDWHQAGKKYGYEGAIDKRALDAAEEVEKFRMEHARALLNTLTRGTNVDIDSEVDHGGRIALVSAMQVGGPDEESRVWKYHLSREAKKALPWIGNKLSTDVLRDYAHAVRDDVAQAAVEHIRSLGDKADDQQEEQLRLHDGMRYTGQTLNLTIDEMFMEQRHLQDQIITAALVRAGLWMQSLPGRGPARRLGVPNGAPAIYSASIPDPFRRTNSLPPGGDFDPDRIIRYFPNKRLLTVIPGLKQMAEGTTTVPPGGWTSEDAAYFGIREWAIDRGAWGTDITPQLESQMRLYKLMSDAINYREDTERDDNDQQVPDAPFKDTWPKLVAKRLIIEAQRAGLDRIALTSGDEQARRYGSAGQYVEEGMAAFYDKRLPAIFTKLTGSQPEPAVLSRTNLTRALPSSAKLPEDTDDTAYLDWANVLTWKIDKEKVAREGFPLFALPMGKRDDSQFDPSDLPLNKRLWFELPWKMYWRLSRPKTAAAVKQSEAYPWPERLTLSGLAWAAEINRINSVYPHMIPDEVRREMQQIRDEYIADNGAKAWEKVARAGVTEFNENDSTARSAMRDWNDRLQWLKSGDEYAPGSPLMKQRAKQGLEAIMNGGDSAADMEFLSKFSRLVRGIDGERKPGSFALPSGSGTIIDGEARRVFDEDIPHMRQIDIQGKNSYDSITLRILRSWRGGDRYVTVEGMPGEKPTGVFGNMLIDWLSKLQADKRLVKFQEGRSEIFGILEQALGSRIADPKIADKAKAIPVLYGVFKPSSRTRGGYLDGVFSTKAAAEEHARRNNAVAKYEEAKVKVIPKADRPDALEILHNPRFVQSTDISPSDKAAMLASVSKMLPSGMTVKTSPIYAVVAIDKPGAESLSVQKLVEQLRALAAPHIASNDLDFFASGNAFGPNDPAKSLIDKSPRYAYESTDPKFALPGRRKLPYITNKRMQDVIAAFGAENPDQTARTSSDPTIRDIQAGIRSVRTRNLTPAGKRDAYHRAMKAISDDAKGLKASLLEMYRARTEFEPWQDVALALLVDRDTARAISKPTDENVKEMIRMRWAYEDLRRVTAQRLGVVVDQFKEWLDGREAIADVIAIGSMKTRRRLEKLRAKLDDSSIGPQGRFALQAEIDALAEKEAAITKRVIKKLKKAGLDPEIVTLDYFKDPWVFSRAARIASSEKAGFWDKYLEWRIAAMLGGPLTNIVNFTGNASHLAYDQVIRRIAEATANIPYGNTNAASFAEMPSYMRSWLPGLAQAGHNFLMAMTTELPAFEVGLARKGIPIPGITIQADALEAGHQSVGGLLGRLLRFPSTTMLLACDEFFKTLTYHTHATSLAFRHASSEGLKGEARSKRMGELLVDPSSPLHVEAWGAAKRVTFQDIHDSKLLPALHKARHAINDFARVPIGSILLPFINTPYRVFQRGVSIPFGPAVAVHHWLTGQWVEKPGQKQRDIADSVLGLGLALAMLWTVDHDDDDEPWITGSAPGDWPARQLAESVKPPQSFKWLNGKYYSYGRVEPLAVAVSTMVDLAESVRAAAREGVGGQISAAMSRLVTSLLDQAADKTFLQTFGDIRKVVESAKNPNGNISNAVSFTRDLVWTAMVPNLLRAPARATDDLSRMNPVRRQDGESIMEAGLRSIPYVTFPVAALAPPPRFSAWGQPLEKPGLGFIGKLFDPIPLKGDVADRPALDMLLSRYNRKVLYGDLPGEKPYFIESPDQFYRVKDEVHYWTNEQYGRLCQEAGQMAANTLMQNRSLHFENPGPKDIDIIREALSKSRRTVRSRMIKELVK